MVLDPIQSVKGKVVIDAFRCIQREVAMAGLEPRQTTSNIGHLHPQSMIARQRGLDKHYYSIAINYRKNELEQKVVSRRARARTHLGHGHARARDAGLPR